MIRILSEDFEDCLILTQDYKNEELGKDQTLNTNKMLR